MERTRRERQLSRNVFMNYLAGIGGMAATFLLFPYIAHHVGIEAYGVWLLFSSIMGYFSQADFGMHGAIIKYSAEARASGDTLRLGKICSTSFLFFAILGLVSAAIYGISMSALWDSLRVEATYRPAALRMAFLVAFLGLLVGTPLRTFNAVMNGAQRYDLERGLVLVGLAFRVAGTVVAVIAGWGIEAIAVMELLAYLLPGALAALYVSSRMPEVSLRLRLVDLRLLRSMLPFSLQLFFMSILAILILQTDNLVISIFLSAGLVTLYSAGFRLYQAVRSLVAFSAEPLLPRASQLSTLHDRRRLSELFVQVTKYAAASSALFGIPIFILADPFIALWLGGQFSAAVPITKILVASFFVNAIHVAANMLLAGVGKPARYVVLHAIWAVSNLILTVLLARRFGLVGVAWGTAIPVVLLEPLYIRIACKEFRINVAEFLRSALLPPWLSAVPATLILLAASGWIGRPNDWSSLVLHATVFVAVYAAVFAIVGMTPEERGTMHRLWNRLTQRRAI